jgi:putative ABC transport system substrate-binding protein
MWRHLRNLFCTWVMGWGCMSAWAQPVSADVRVLVVRSDASAAYADAAQAVVEALQRKGVARGDVQQLLASELVARLKSGTKPLARVYVALGSEATNLLLDTSFTAPVLSALVPRRSFERMLQVHGRVASDKLSAIYLDQPLTRHLSLIKQVFPQAKRLGVLWGPDSMLSASHLKAVASASGMSLREARVTGDTGVFAGLNEVLGDSDVFLALADPLVFNGTSIQNILLATFRAGVPMVAFSPAYVRAGALMALYTSPAQAGGQAADLVANVLAGKGLPEQAIEPNDFEVGVNQHVARSLGLTLDGAALRLALRRLERLP